MTQGGADRTQEIDAADILEVAADVGSIAPLAVDAGSTPSLTASTGAADETVKIRAQRSRRRTLGGVAIGTVGALSLVILAAAALSRGAGPQEARAVAPSPTAAAPTSASPAAPVESSPWTAVAAPVAPPTSGTISVASGAGPLVVDGARATSTAVVVTCGSHTVRVGRGAKRTVVVPCGGGLAIERSGKISLR